MQPPTSRALLSTLTRNDLPRDLSKQKIAKISKDLSADFEFIFMSIKFNEDVQDLSR